MSDRTKATEAYPPIGSYAIIGDCHTAALISSDCSIDWYCPMRFDAPAVFCRILDAEKGGYFQIAPATRYSASRRYRGATNLLETTFTTDDGTVRVTDLMPIHRRQAERQGYDVGTSHRILRLVEVLAGTVDLELRFKPTFDYARADTKLTTASEFGAVAAVPGASLTLACPGTALVPGAAGELRGRLHLRAGERRWLVLSYSLGHDDPDEVLGPTAYDRQLASTIDYWEEWSASCTYRGPYRSAVLRSALTLKLLAYEPTGAIVAAPTTSLPEQIRGQRNWDYRYTWIRDSALTLYALMTVGYDEEAADFFHWLERTQQDEPTWTPQIMYAIDGSVDLPERILHHLEGYRFSRPVRVGNAAAKQRQLDIFGEVLNAAYLHFRPKTSGGRDGRERSESEKCPSPKTWKLLSSFVDQAAARWQQPDNGIWEVRSGPQQFLHSRLMCWTALDRGIRLATECGLPAPIDRWQQTRHAIREAILLRGFNTDVGAFTQAFGSPALDATALAVARLGFLPATDPRVQSTVERIRCELTRHGLVYRYRAEDGLDGSEAAFVLCTFWLVDALALGGRLDEAQELFERVVGRANDVGLLAEEIDPATGELLGNFPQGFSHLALIGAAVNLAKAAKHGAETQAATEAEREGQARHAAALGE